MDNEFLWQFVENVNRLIHGYMARTNFYPNVCLVDKNTYRMLSIDKELKRIFDMEIIVVDTLQECIKVGHFYG